MTASRHNCVAPHHYILQCNNCKPYLKIFRIILLARAKKIPTLRQCREDDGLLLAWRWITTWRWYWHNKDANEEAFLVMPSIAYSAAAAAALVFTLALAFALVFAFGFSSTRSSLVKACLTASRVSSIAERNSSF